MAEETAYYKVSGFPAALMERFEEAVGVVSRASIASGRGSVGVASAFNVVLRAGLSRAVIEEGQRLNAKRLRDEPKVDRGFQIPAALKRRVLDLADAQGIKIGSVGRLVFIALADRMEEIIEQGVTAGRTEEAPAEQQEAVPA